MWVYGYKHSHGSVPVSISPSLSPVTGTRVTPTVGFVDRDMEDMSWLSPEPCEVDTVFTLPLTHLTDPNNLVMRQMVRSLLWWLCIRVMCPLSQEVV